MSTDLNARPWIRAGEKTRCTRHSVDFVLPNTCPGCGADPGAPIEDEIDAPLPKPPKGCKSLVQLEHWFTELAIAAAKSAASLARIPRRKRDFHDESGMAKHRDVAIKAMRAAGELALRRDDKALVDAREKRIRDRQRGVSH